MVCTRGQKGRQQFLTVKCDESGGKQPHQRAAIPSAELRPELSGDVSGNHEMESQ